MLTAPYNGPIHTGQWTKGQKPDPQIYIQLITECRQLGKENEFSPCFTELQRDFLKERPPKLKSLIRLVKYWFQTVRAGVRQVGGGGERGQGGEEGRDREG